MFLQALFDPLSIFVLIAIAILMLLSFLWFRVGQRDFDGLQRGIGVLRYLGLQLNPAHPIRRRLESAPVVDLSFEEIAKLMAGKDEVQDAAQGLIRLQDRLAWIERFSQYAIHLGILGTVFALVSSDPTDLDAFRASLPLALGTTFWGLIGALLLSTLAGASESVLERSQNFVRQALLDALDDIADPKSVNAPHPLVLQTPPEATAGEVDNTLIEQPDLMEPSSLTDEDEPREA